MKKIFLVVLSCILFQSAGAAGHAEHPSVHGMLIVGQSRIYLSHLPMFHSPHDYQVLLEGHFSSEGEKAYRNSLDSSSETIYTLVPEAFVLPEILQNRRTFEAQIYKGHFERGGTVIADKVTVVIDRVLYFKKFATDEAKPKEARYVLFGHREEMFLAHTISAKPDFDQIIKVQPLSFLSEELKRKGSIPVGFPNLLNAPLHLFDSLDGSLLDGDGAQMQKFEIEKMIYLETGDLS